MLALSWLQYVCVMAPSHHHTFSLIQDVFCYTVHKVSTGEVDCIALRWEGEKMKGGGKGRNVCRQRDVVESGRVE